MIWSSILWKRTSDLDARQALLEANPQIALKSFQEGYAGGAQDMLHAVQEHLIRVCRSPSQNLEFTYKNQTFKYRCFPAKRA